MRLYSFIYYIKEGLKSIFTHRFMSFAAMGVITACLVLMGSFLLVVVNIGHLLSDLENQNEVIAFVDADYDSTQALGLFEDISSVKGVARAEYISKGEALDKFRQDFGEESPLLEGLDEDNPLRDRYRITLTDLKDTADVAQRLGAIEGVAKVEARSDISDKIIRMRNVVTVVCVVLVIILILMSIFIISNTVNLTIFNRREEIAIMKMVGATNGFVRSPFIIQGLLLGAGGAVIALFLQWSIYNSVVATVLESIQFVPVVAFEDISGRLFAMFAGVGVLVGGVGSAITLRKFLKV